MKESRRPRRTTQGKKGRRETESRFTGDGRKRKGNRRAQGARVAGKQSESLEGKAIRSWASGKRVIRRGPERNDHQRGHAKAGEQGKFWLREKGYWGQDTMKCMPATKSSTKRKKEGIS